MASLNCNSNKSNVPFDIDVMNSLMNSILSEVVSNLSHQMKRLQYSKWDSIQISNVNWIPIWLYEPGK